MRRDINPPGGGPEGRPANTQRQRLVLGMVGVASGVGYARANVSEVIAAAGVSRRTFYDHFADKQDCFRVAVEEANAALLARVRQVVSDQAPEQALQATVRGLVEFTNEQPALGRFVMNEPLGAPAVALSTRDDGLAAIDSLVRARLRQASREALAPDFSARLILGGIYRSIGPRLRRGEPKLSTLLPDLERWVAGYEQPIGSHRWRTLKPGPMPPRSPFVPEEPLHAPPPFPKGRLRLSKEDVAESRHLRIMFAAAELAQAKGYDATTVADIAKRARVDGRAFYAMFKDKQEAFMATHEFGSQHVMTVTADAFFSGDAWPERNWEAGRAFTQFLETNPLFANVGFIEAYAVGPGAIQRVEDSHRTFAMLLQDGYRHLAADRRPPHFILETIVTTIFETVYTQVRAGKAGRLSALLPHFTFLVLSPFLGADQANAFIAEQQAGN